MNRAEKIDRAADAAQDAYDEAYERISLKLIFDNIADGADFYSPDGAEVNRLVLEEFKRKKEDHG